MNSKIKKDCCSEVKSSSTCPLCDTRKQAVDAITLKHWLVASLVPLIGEGPFFFCDTKDCAVVYFSGDHSIRYTKEHLRDRIASKEASGPATVCYLWPSSFFPPQGPKRLFRGWAGLPLRKPQYFLSMSKLLWMKMTRRFVWLPMWLGPPGTRGTKLFCFSMVAPSPR